MKISVSNIAWKNDNIEKFFELLSTEKCQGVEIAPSKIWSDLSEIHEKDIINFKTLLQDYKLELVGFHSLLYNLNDLQLFKDKESRTKTKKYLFKLIDLCSSLGGKQLIFGSPKNRDTFNLDNDQIDEISSEFFRAIADYAKGKRVYFCIEPLGKNETNFITSVKEGGELVKKINHPNFKLHVDTKAIFYTKEKPSDIFNSYDSIIQHIHISDQELKEPGTINKNHSEISNAIKSINYKNFLSLEMRRVEGDEINSIQRSLNFIKKNYIN